MHLKDENRPSSPAKPPHPSRSMTDALNTHVHGVVHTFGVRIEATWDSRRRIDLARTLRLINSSSENMNFYLRSPFQKHVYSHLKIAVVRDGPL